MAAIALLVVLMWISALMLGMVAGQLSLVPAGTDWSVVLVGWLLVLFLVVALILLTIDFVKAVNRHWPL